MKRNPDVNILGWSTGGLAAYMQASQGGVKKVILIAPGNTANLVVGEGFHQWPLNVITIRTLTTDTYVNGNQDPHIDPIHPRSPIEIPAFSASLLSTSALSADNYFFWTKSGFYLPGPRHCINTWGERCKDKKLHP